MKATKRGSGGALLLKKHGPDYFKKLGKKSAKRRQEALKLLKEKEASSAKSAKTRGR